MNPSMKEQLEAIRHLFVKQHMKPIGKKPSKAKGGSV